MIPNLICVCKYSHLKFNWMGWVVRPGLATLAMGIAVFIARNLLPINRIFTLLEIALGVAVYFGTAILVKAMTPEDLRSLRRSKKKG